LSWTKCSAQDAKQAVFVDARMHPKGSSQVGTEVEAEKGDVGIGGHTDIHVGRNVAEEATYEATDVTKQSIHQSQH
jgi:hypothetical protein